MFDTGEKQIKLSDAAEVREADVTPEKSTIVKGRERAVSAALAGQGGQRHAVQRVIPCLWRDGAGFTLPGHGTEMSPFNRTYLPPLCCLECKAKSPPCL